MTTDMPLELAQAPDRPAEQFEDHVQQRVASTLGMWVFLANEILFFGTLFVGFYVLRQFWTADFVEGAKELKWWIGGINTAVLLISSYVMAMAVHAAHEGQNRKIFHRLLITAALGILFLLFKAGEYGIDYHEHLIPAWNYTRAIPDGGTRGEHVELFIVIYFITTALHALHVLIGVILLLVLAIPASRGRFTPKYHNFVDGVGLYWHFVDLVWIFLYPTLYLLRHG